MTPVEERIDHEEAKRIAREWTSGEHSYPTEEMKLVGRVLLTEHSAREESWRLVERYCESSKDDDYRLVFTRGGASLREISVGKRAWDKLDDVPALPATEPAQPEEEHYPGSTEAERLAAIERVKRANDA